MEVVKIKKNPKINLLITKLKVAAYVRVSTKSEMQLNSFESQQRYYENKIKQNDNWTFVGIYSDEGISGTETLKRESFLKMVRDAERGKIDLILTKSISRFGRNTLDTLKYARLLKEKGIGIIFEEESINTLNSSSEMLLTVLSTVAQQEIENMSSHLKLGKEILMREGKLTNGRTCYGYDYDKKTKKVVVNKYEANVVKIIFAKYLECKSIIQTAMYLRNKKYLDYYGTTRWEKSSVRKLLGCKKYIGIMEMKKTVIKDLYEHTRKKNEGEEDKYIVYGFCEKIIDEETFYKVQELLKNNIRELKNPIIRNNEMRCGFCGYTLGVFNRNTKHETLVCNRTDSNGKIYCKNSKAIKVELLNDILHECLIKFMKKKKSLNHEKDKKIIKDIKNEKELLLREKSKYIDLLLSKKINKNNYKEKNRLIDIKISSIDNQLEEINQKINNDDLRIKKEIEIYDLIVEKFDNKLSFYKLLDNLGFVLIVGGYNEKELKNPYMVRFIILNNHNIQRRDVIKCYKKMTICNTQDFDYCILLDYKSKYQKAMMKEYKDGKRKIYKNIRVRLEIIEEK